MQIEYDPQLVEQAVFLAARAGPPHLEGDLHAATDPLYTMPPGRDREAGFRRVYAAWFSRLKLDAILVSLLAERPLIAEHVSRCIVRQAPRRKAESAELFVRPSDAGTVPTDRTLIIQLCPPSLLDTDRLAAYLRRELFHISDMLDARFGYELESVSGLPARQNLVRDRYRVLWDIYVEGRLNREGRSADQRSTGLPAMFARAFNRPAAEGCRSTFDRILQAVELTHSQLLNWAMHPQSLFPGTAERRLTTQPGPGEACPLCGFPTHDWFEFSGNGSGSLANSLQSHYPDWGPQDGACRLCAERHLSVDAAVDSRPASRGCGHEVAQRASDRPLAGEDMPGVYLSDRRRRLQSDEGPGLSDPDPRGPHHRSRPANR
jgi:hypothetical protein